MRTTDVPQDDSILEGHQRACYAQDADGRWVVATSRGWEVERIANAHAVQEVQAAIDAALADVHAGRASPLAWHMARFHMTESLIAAHAGIWRWQVRRHLRPAVFATLGRATLAKYAQALGITVDELRAIPAASAASATS